MKKFKKEDILNPSEMVKIERKTAEQYEAEDEHTHDFIELVYISEGKTLQFIDGKQYLAKKGDMLVINYNQTHSFEALEALTYIDLLMEPQFMGEELLDIENIYEIFSISLFNEFAPATGELKQLICFSGNEILEMENIIHYMVSEYEAKKTGYRSILAGYMRIIFSKLLREMKGEKSGHTGYMTNIAPDIVEYIDRHCFEKISLSALAQRCFYNPSYFSYAFKKYCGKSLSEYIKEKRIAHAADLLKNTNYTVSGIGELVGYTDKTYFYKIFKEVTGKTPAEFRNSIKNNN